MSCPWLIVILTRNVACHRFSLVPSLPFPLTKWPQKGDLGSGNRSSLCNVSTKITCEPPGTSLEKGVNVPFSVGPSAWPTLKEVIHTHVMLLIPLYT